MPHLASKCDCGRKIHLPKTATRGYQWTCHSCGKTWVLADHGKPIHSERSRPPEVTGGAASSTQGCLGAAVAVAIVGGIVYAMFGETGVVTAIVLAIVVAVVVGHQLYGRE